MAILTRLQMLARAERSARRGDEQPHADLIRQRDALKSSLEALRRDDQAFYEKLERLRTERDALEQRAIAALQADDEPAARRALGHKIDVEALKTKVTEARDLLARQLAASEQTLDALQARIDVVARYQTPPPPAQQRPTSERPASERPYVDREARDAQTSRWETPAPASDSQPHDASKDRWDAPPPPAHVPTSEAVPAPRTGGPNSPASQPSTGDKTSSSVFDAAPYAAARRAPEPTYPQAAPTQRTAPTQCETPAYPQPESSDAFEDLFADDTLAQFDAMERKIAEMESRAELSAGHADHALPFNEVLNERPSAPIVDTWGHSDFDDPLADPLQGAFDELDAQERAGESERALAALRKRMRGE